MKLPHCVPTALSIAFLIGAVAPGVVAQDKEHDTIREALRRGEVLPLEKILAIVEQRVPGEVIEIELERGKKIAALIYEIKVLTPTGRVREIKIDAHDGNVLSIEDD